MVEYTTEDMKKLAEMSSEVLQFELEDLNYDPEAFKTFLHSRQQHTAIKYLFETPYEDIPMLINNGYISGYLEYRLTVCK